MIWTLDKSTGCGYVGGKSKHAFIEGSPPPTLDSSLSYHLNIDCKIHYGCSFGLCPTLLLEIVESSSENLINE